MVSSFTHCLNEPKMSSRDSLTAGKLWDGGGSLKHHGKVWNCHQAAFKNHRVLHSHDCWFPNISKRCQTFRNGKPKFSVFPHLKPHELQMISRKNKTCEIWRFRTFPGAKDTCLDLRTNMAKCIKWRVYCIIACLQAFE